jgi:hypothetical protein
MGVTSASARQHLSVIAVIESRTSLPAPSPCMAIVDPQVSLRSLHGLTRGALFREGLGELVIRVYLINVRLAPTAI